MRLTVSVVFIVLIIVLMVCIIFAKRSKKAIGNYVAFLLAGMASPVLGNLILIIATNETVANIGCYIYFLGMDTAVYSILHFAYKYCEIGGG